MSPKLPAKKRFEGQILFGIIIAAGLFTMLSTAVISLVFTAYELIAYTRARTTARLIANEKIEIIRNLAFDDVGTVGGIPPGIIAQTEETIQNSLLYTIKTRITYVDDEFDGLAPDDLLANDYKQARVDISWGGLTASGENTVTLISNIAPKGIETTVGGGTLSILVIDADGEPVPQASAQIIADSVTPPINLALESNQNGRIILPGAPACTDNCYRITVTKEGFSTERTYSTTEIANPSKQHLSILEGQLVEVAFAIDQTGTLEMTTMDTKENEFALLPNQIIHLRGEKTLGTDALDQPIYKFDQEVVTDSAGTLVIEQLEWDTYHLSLPEDSTKNIAGTNPFSPFPFLPGQNLDLFVSLAPKTPNNLLVFFTDATDNPLALVSATLRDSGSYEETLETGGETDPDFGQVFFSGLENTTYSLEATALGFLDFSENIDVLGSMVQTIILETQ